MPQGAKLPAGYTLDPVPQGLPQGYTLDPPTQPVANQGDMLKSQLPNVGGVMQDAKQVADDLYTGGVKKFGEGIATISSGLNKLPWIGETLAPKVGVKSFQQQMQPSNTTQQIGGIGEQVGEMALTGGPLKAGGKLLATKLPFLGRYAAPIFRVGAEGVNAGISALTHGQPVAQSAALGAAGAGIGEVGAAVGPRIVQKALGIYGKEMQHGQTPGAAILDETSGIRASTIARQAGQKASQLTKSVESAAASSPQIATTKPALAVIDNEIAKAANRNSGTIISKLNTVRDQLTKDVQTGQAFGTDLTPEKVLNLKRGIGDLVNSWTFQEKRGIQGTLQRVYGALDSEVDRTAPGTAQLNQRISSLITGSKAAKATALGRRRGLTTQIAQHVGIPAAAGALGYAQGGQGRAAEYVGAAALLSTPEAKIAIARLVRTGMPAVLARGVVASQLSGAQDTQPTQ